MDVDWKKVRKKERKKKNGRIKCKEQRKNRVSNRDLLGGDTLHSYAPSSGWKKEWDIGMVRVVSSAGHTPP
jgi:hypothetical protein